MYKVGIIGTGIIGEVHMKAIANIEDLCIAAVVDVNEDKAVKVAEEYNCPYFLDYKKIDTPLDAVIINLPHFLHAEVACWFLERGVHAFVEKPMATSYAECLAMIEAAEKGGAKLAVGHVQRYFKGNEVVKKFYEEKTFGELAMTNERRNIFYFDDSRPRWFLSKKLSGGGIFMNYGAHGLDRLLYITGANVTEVNSNCTHLLPDFDVEGHAQVFLKFDSGVSSVMTFCGYRGFSEEETTFYFTEGAVRFIFPNKIEIATNGQFEPYELENDGNPFERQLREFVKYLDGKESTIPTGEYGANIIRLIQKAYQ